MGFRSSAVAVPREAIATARAKQGGGSSRQPTRQGGVFGRTPAGAAERHAQTGWNVCRFSPEPWRLHLLQRIVAKSGSQQVCEAEDGLPDAAVEGANGREGGASWHVHRYA
jgi:hypothetical protein